MQSQMVSRKGRTRPRQRVVNLAGKAAQLGVQTIMVVLGWKVSIALLRHTGRLLFKRRGKDKAAEHEAPLPLPAADGLPQVDPALHWRPIAAPAPQVPPDYKLLASGPMPCSVYSLYYHLLSQQSDFLMLQHHLIGGQYNYVRRPWSPAPLDMSEYPLVEDGSLLQERGESVFEFALGAGNSGTFVRTCTFTTPRKPPMGQVADCVQRQQLAVFEGGELVFATAMSMTNIPYKDCFLVNTVWEVRPGDQANTCTLAIYGKVAFVKRSMMAGIIKASTFRDLTSFYQALVPNAEALLRQQPAATEPSAHPGNQRGPSLLARASNSRAGAQRAGSLAPSDKGQQLAHTVPLDRQLRVAVVMLLLVASVLHQLFLHQQLLGVQEHLAHFQQ